MTEYIYDAKHFRIFWKEYLALVEKYGIDMDVDENGKQWLYPTGSDDHWQRCIVSEDGETLKYTWYLRPNSDNPKRIEEVIKL